MTVKDFNTDKGLYIFELNNFETAFHSHPAIEIIVAKEGVFSVAAADSIYRDLTFAVIDSNVAHKLSASTCNLKIIMIEHNNTLTKRILSDSKIVLINGLYCSQTAQHYLEILTHLTQVVAATQNKIEYDKRIKKVIEYIDKLQLEDKFSVNSLQEIANLSASRLSHLFKENVGISLKKYLVWHRLKTTIAHLLQNKEDLFSSLIVSGFYDQAHFSHAFKIMLGIKPSHVYNSRSIQV